MCILLICEPLTGLLKVRTNLCLQGIYGLKGLLVPQLLFEGDLDQITVKIARVIKYMYLQQRLFAVHRWPHTDVGNTFKGLLANAFHSDAINTF